jgi:glycosyltransferase involved in cell wall biosynthesis
LEDENTRPMVLVLNHFARPPGASGGTRHVDIFGLLAKWDAIVIASDRSYLTPNSRDDSEGVVRMVRTIAYEGAGRRRMLNWLSYAVAAFVAAMRGMRPSVVYGSTPHLLAPVAGWLLARRYRVPFILEVRDLWPQILVEMDRLERGSWTYRVLSRIENSLYRRAVRIVVLAEGVRDELVRRGVDGAKIVVIPNGAAPTDFAVGAPRDGLRDRYQFRDRVFVYAGAHGPANGLDLLLDAAELVRDDHPEAHFVLFGDGPSKAELVASTRSRGLDNVEFRDPVPKSAMPEVLAAADVGVHVLADVPLFRYGVSPNKVVDYMAAGLPVLTNSPGVVGDLVASAGAGVAVEPGDLEKGIRAVLRLSPEERAARGDAGRMYIARERSPAVLAERLEALLDSLV